MFDLKEFYKPGTLLICTRDSWDGDRHRSSYGTIMDMGNEKHNGDPEVRQGDFVIYIKNFDNFYGTWLTIKDSEGNSWDIPPENLREPNHKELQERKGLRIR